MTTQHEVLKEKIKEMQRQKLERQKQMGKNPVAVVDNSLAQTLKGVDQGIAKEHKRGMKSIK